MSIFAADGLTKLDPRYYAYGVNGAMFMMLAHGITSAGMFFLVGVIYDRAHTRDLNKLGGLSNIMPLYGAISYVIFFGSMGLPGLCGFVAEVFVVLSAFNYSPIAGDPGRGGGDPDGRAISSGRSSASSWAGARPGRASRHGSPRDRHRRSPGGPDHRHGHLSPDARPELDGPIGRPDGSRGGHVLARSMPSRVKFNGSVCHHRHNELTPAQMRWPKAFGAKGTNSSAERTPEGYSENKVHLRQSCEHADSIFMGLGAARGHDSLVGRL